MTIARHDPVRAPGTTLHASPVRVALAGCGTVGSAVVRLLHDRRQTLAAIAGTSIEVTSILVRGSPRPRPEAAAGVPLTTAPAELLAAEADIVVEVIGGIEPALTIARATLERGAVLVTANKALVAAHGPMLARLAAERGGLLLFEGAVAAGLPVLRALRDQLALADVQAVWGILNGTTNLILTRMAEGRPYAEALAEAQALGFAEADPTRDVSGEDTADKLRILAWQAFGVDPSTLFVRQRGIAPGADELVRDARRTGGVVRLVARAERTADGVSASVAPVVVQAESPLARVVGADNLVGVESRWGGTVHWLGPGAGGSATATAVVGDLLHAVGRHLHTPLLATASGPGAVALARLTPFGSGGTFAPSDGTAVAVPAAAHPSS